MEKMPFRPEADAPSTTPSSSERKPQETADWRSGLPSLAGTMSTLRELRVSDAPALLVSMSSDDVSRFISPPPSTVEGFEKFISWSHRERAAGRSACFAVVPHGSEAAIGVFQLRALDPDCATIEWGFALAVEYWGTGLFAESDELVVDFAFEVVGARRLEARAPLKNGRGNGALRKMGATQEGVLRRSFLRHGEHLDQALWTILREEWVEAKAVWGPNIVH
jgi:ribosomal-protein-alanine N-acetyltransferase